MAEVVSTHNITLHMISYLSVMLAIIVLQDAVQHGLPCVIHCDYISQAYLSAQGMRVSGLGSVCQTGMSVLPKQGPQPPSPSEFRSASSIYTQRLECAAAWRELLRSMLCILCTATRDIALWNDRRRSAKSARTTASRARPELVCAQVFEDCTPSLAEMLDQRLRRCYNTKHYG